MRKWIMIVAAALLAMQACNQQQEEYKITVGVEEAANRWVRLLSRQDRSYVTVDSVFVEPGTDATMTGRVDQVTTMYLTAEGMGGSIQLLVENANYDIEGAFISPEIKTDSRAQQDLNAFNERMRPVEEQMSALREQLQAARQEDDTEKAESLSEQYNALYSQVDSIQLAYAAEHTSSYASVMALRSTFYYLDAGELDKILTSYDEPLKQMEEYKFMADKLEHMKAVTVGQPYVDIELATPEGGTQSLSDVHNGNVLLVDFWASWCGPCRRANPGLVEIYLEYHDRGFDIMGVSLDRDSASWVEAIREDNLSWNHISDLKYWDSKGAELYGISAIPHAVLIDRNGIIAATRTMEGDELREAIESLL